MAKLIEVKICQRSLIVTEDTGILIRAALRGIDKRVAEIDREAHNRQLVGWVETCSQLQEVA